MKTRTLAILIALCLFGGAVQAQQIIGAVTAGTTSYSSGDALKVYGGKNYDAMKSINFEWTSTSGGAFTATIDGAYGWIERVTFAPVSSASPTNNYDVTLSDVDGIDVFGGLGANQSATTAATVLPLISAVIDSSTHTTKYALDGQQMTLSVTNAGNAKKGKIRVYVKN